MYAEGRELVNGGFLRLLWTLPNTRNPRNPTGGEPRNMKEATAVRQMI